MSARQELQKIENRIRDMGKVPIKDSIEKIKKHIQHSEEIVKHELAKQKALKQLLECAIKKAI